MLLRTTVPFYAKIFVWQDVSEINRRLKKMTDNVCDTGKVQVYWQRWWILALFSLFTMEQCAIWNTFGPIAQSAEKVKRKRTVVGLESRCLVGQTRPLPCSPCGAALTMQSGFYRLLFFSLKA